MNEGGEWIVAKIAIPYKGYLININNLFKESKFMVIPTGRPSVSFENLEGAINYIDSDVRGKK